MLDAQSENGDWDDEGTDEEEEVDKQNVATSFLRQGLAASPEVFHLLLSLHTLGNILSKIYGESNGPKEKVC